MGLPGRKLGTFPVRRLRPASRKLEGRNFSMGDGLQKAGHAYP